MTSDAVQRWRDRIEADENAARQSRSLLLIANTGFCSQNADAEATFWHYDRYHPRRALRQVEAKRKVIELWERANRDPLRVRRGRGPCVAGGRGSRAAG